MRRKFLAAALILFAGLARAQFYSNVIKVEATTGAAIQVGDAANNAIRVNVVAGGGSGGTSSSFGAAFPATGTAAGFTDGTNMQGARVVDLDTGAGTYYGLTVNLVRRVSGTPTEIIGQTTMAASLPVAIASDQSAVPASQSGTWTVQPGNTANTTPWLVRTIEQNSCSGNTVVDTNSADVATGAGTDITTVDTCVFLLSAANVTTSAVTLTIRDRSTLCGAAACEYVEGLSVPANSTATWDFKGKKFTTGVKAIAGTASALNVFMTGVQ